MDVTASLVVWIPISIAVTPMRRLFVSVAGVTLRPRWCCLPRVAFAWHAAREYAEYAEYARVRRVRRVRPSTIFGWSSTQISTARHWLVSLIALSSSSDSRARLNQTNTQTHKHPTSAKHGSLAFPFADALGVATAADSVRCGTLGLSPQVRQAPQ